MIGGYAKLSNRLRHYLRLENMYHHTMAGMVEFCPKDMLFFPLLRDSYMIWIANEGHFGVKINKDCLHNDILMELNHILWI